MLIAGLAVVYVVFITVIPTLVTSDCRQQALAGMAGHVRGFAAGGFCHGKTPQRLTAALSLRHQALASGLTVSQNRAHLAQHGFSRSVLEQHGLPSLTARGLHAPQWPPGL